MAKPTRKTTKRPTAAKRITKPATTKVWGVALQDTKKGTAGWYSAKAVPGRRAKI